MAIENSYNFKRVGALVTTSGVVGGNRLKGLAREGYELVVNLLPDTSEYSVENEQGIVEAQGVKYVYIPVDFKNPTFDDYRKFVSAIEEAGSSKVHIHCAANYRVSAFYALYAESRNIWSESEADEFIRALWDPHEAQGWSEFIAQIRRGGFDP